MILLLICISLPTLVISDDFFDPDIDICNNPIPDFVVNTDEDKTFIFKGKYFWETLPLDRQINSKSKEGIIGFGDLITNQWPELKEEIKASFTVPNPNKHNSFMTVFVVGNNWIGYEKGSVISEGKTDKWPDFDKLTITASFNYEFKSTWVYVLHSNNKKYNLYDFTSLKVPKRLVDNYSTVCLQTSLLFLDDKRRDGQSIAMGTLDQGLAVGAAVTYKPSIVLMGPKKYCVIDMTRGLDDKNCILSDIKRLFGCPLDLSKRPKSIPLSTTPELQSSTIDKSLFGQNLTHDENNTELNIIEEIEFSTISGNDTITEINTVLDAHTNSSDINATIIILDKTMSTVLSVVFIIGLICVSLISLYIIYCISKSVNMRPKGSVFYN